MKNLISFLRKIKRIYLKYHFCYYKTIVANFRLLPFRSAIHLPLVIYNKTELKLSRSHIQLNVPSRFGLIKWGYNEDFFVPTKMPSMLFMINGCLIINGPIRVSPGGVFRISGIAELGKHIEIGGGCKMLINNDLYIGNQTRFAFGSIICDTNFHYICDQGIIHRKDGKVIIGNSVWIGNNCSIVKNAVIPDHAVVSNKSLVNKDFSTYRKAVLLAGSPAKVIKEHCSHIRSPQMEKYLDEYFLKKDGDPNVIYNLPVDYSDNEDLNRYFD